MKEVRRRGPGEYLRPGAFTEVIDKGAMSVAVGPKGIGDARVVVHSSRMGQV